MPVPRQKLVDESLSDLPGEEGIRLAELVMNLNAFRCGEELFLQVHSMAMSTRKGWMAPSYANILMGRLEEWMLSTVPGGRVPPFYRRFIDDIFGVWLHGEELVPFGIC